MEAGPPTTRISVRTKPGGVDATVLTGAFGGGGHARAAGASVDAPLAEARARVLAEADRLAAAVARPGDAPPTAA
jgi:phosphoesterase RecJ-like protein